MRKVSCSTHKQIMYLLEIEMTSSDRDALLAIIDILLRPGGPIDLNMFGATSTVKCLNEYLKSL